MSLSCLAYSDPSKGSTTECRPCSGHENAFLMPSPEPASNGSGSQSMPHTPCSPFCPPPERATG